MPELMECYFHLVDLFTPGNQLFHSFSGDAVEVVSFEPNDDGEVILTVRYEDGSTEEIHWGDFENWEQRLFPKEPFLDNDHRSFAEHSDFPRLVAS